MKSANNSNRTKQAMPYLKRKKINKILSQNSEIFEKFPATEQSFDYAHADFEKDETSS